MTLDWVYAPLLVFAWLRICRNDSVVRARLEFDVCEPCCGPTMRASGAERIGN